MAPATQAARHSRPSSPFLPALDAMWDQAVEKRGHTLRCRNHTFSPSVLPRGGTELILTSLEHCKPCFEEGHARTHAGQSGMRPWRLVVLPPTWGIATRHHRYLNSVRDSPWCLRSQAGQRASNTWGLLLRHGTSTPAPGRLHYSLLIIHALAGMPTPSRRDFLLW
jgi:hypothetical protein